MHRDYAGARVHSRVQQGIASVRIDGMLTPDVSFQLLQDCQQDVVTHRPVAMVARYDLAGLALDPEALYRSANGVIGHSGALALPTALVVSPDTVDFWAAYTWLMARRGVIRGLFTDPKAAEAWAARKGAVFAAQRHLGAQASK